MKWKGILVIDAAVCCHLDSKCCLVRRTLKRLVLQCGEASESCRRAEKPQNYFVPGRKLAGHSIDPKEISPYIPNMIAAEGTTRRR
jgi:hypothetical protein